MNQPDTKQRILDSAEKLFAEDGYHCTSLRAITGGAGVNLAAVNYHFGSKNALLEAVFERRLMPLNRERQGCLLAVRKSAADRGGHPEPREVLRAFIEPTMRFRNSGDGAEKFVSLVGRSLAEPVGSVRETFLGQMRPTFILLFETLCLALPELPQARLYYRLHFALASMGHAMCWADRLIGPAHEGLPSGVVLPDDSTLLLDELLSFVTAGMEA